MKMLWVVTGGHLACMVMQSPYSSLSKEIDKTTFEVRVINAEDCDMS